MTALSHSHPKGQEMQSSQPPTLSGARTARDDWRKLATGAAGALEIPLSDVIGQGA